MPDRTVRALLACTLLAAEAALAQAAERPDLARPCPGNLPEGVRLPPQPGCDAPGREPERKGVDEGFRDLGNGVSVRMNGRAGAEFGVRR